MQKFKVNKVVVEASPNIHQGKFSILPGEQESIDEFILRVASELGEKINMLTKIQVMVETESDKVIAEDTFSLAQHEGETPNNFAFRVALELRKKIIEQNG